MSALLIQLALLLSIFCVVFALGLQARFGDAIFLLRRPGLLLRSLVAINLVMVVFAIAVDAVFKLDPEIKVAILVLAVSPVPPVLPKNNQKAGGSASYGVGLLVAAVVASLVIVPVAIDLLGRYFGVSAYMPISKILPVVLLTALLPLLGGMLVHRFGPGFAARVAGPLGKIGGILLLLAVLPILVVKAPQMWALVGNGVVLVMLAFSVVGLLVGHVMGGPEPHERTVLALATCARHPGIAIAIIGLNFPELKSAALAVIIWHLLVATLVMIPYNGWRKRANAAVAV